MGRIIVNLGIGTVVQKQENREYESTYDDFILESHGAFHNDKIKTSK